jgi:hypothetical protein
MMRIVSARAACLALGVLAFACAAGSAWGQRPAPGPMRGQGPSPNKSTVPPGQPGFRDPTQPSPEVREAIEASQFVPSTGPGSAAAPALVLPQVKLKARLVGAVGRPVAMLEINGQLFTVYSDSETTIANPGGGATTLLVRTITASEVQIEVLPLKKLLIFH